MKKTLTILITFLSITVFGQTYSEVMNNQMTFEKWEKESKTNIRLLTKYGNAVKTEEQKKLDQELIETSLKIDGTPRKASDHMIQVGFSYVYRDIKTAMYRFNQAFLLDSTNSDIYWGYGGVYMVLGNYELAKEQYLDGLKINPNNPHLLTDYGTYFMIQYSNLLEVSKNDAEENLDLAIQNFNKSYLIDPNDQNTSYKLSVAYLSKGDCENALSFYKKCKALGGRPIPKEYDKEIKSRCKN
jgi:tetratricopeptide (TPR) repeat protein